MPGSRNRSGPTITTNMPSLPPRVATPIAGGEEETTLADFERLVEKGGVEIVQPDVTRAGGISECLRIADYARRQGRRCVLHAWSTGIIKAATLHVLAAMEEAEYMEYCVQTTDLNQRLVAERFPLVDGHVAIPERPGPRHRAGRGGREGIRRPIGAALGRRGDMVLDRTTGRKHPPAVPANQDHPHGSN